MGRLVLVSGWYGTVVGSGCSGNSGCYGTLLGRLVLVSGWYGTVLGGIVKYFSKYYQPLGSWSALGRLV